MLVVLYVLSFATLYAPISDCLFHGRLLACAYVVLAIVSISHCIAATLMDPSDKNALAARQDREPPLTAPHFCFLCNVMVPVRTKHCRRCNKCVAIFDHHDEYLNSCVGERNRPAFLTFLVSGAALLVLQLALCVQASIWAASHASTSVQAACRLAIGPRVYCSLLILTALLLLPHLYTALCFLLFQAYLHTRGQNTYEYSVDQRRRNSVSRGAAGAAPAPTPAAVAAAVLNRPRVRHFRRRVCAQRLQRVWREALAAQAQRALVLFLSSEQARALPLDVRIVIGEFVMRRHRRALRRTESACVRCSPGETPEHLV